MADIFISYSRKDSPQALALADRLRNAGLEVWIDQHGIEAATRWSDEIVRALDASKAVIVLLSTTSITSESVGRELSLAFEAEKVLLPVDLEEVALPSHFRYPLAGIQRAHISDFDAILRSLKKIGILENKDEQVAKDVWKNADTAKAPKSQDESIRRLAVLPFEDLSPGKDHDWFSDGLTYELIDTLAGLSSLFVVDRQSAHEFKNSTLKARQIATELGVRYLVTGGVQKAGDKIRISATLVDTADGKTLWHFKQSGVMDNIFDIQERVAKEITDGLLLTLTPVEEKRMEERSTENPEAYELYLQSKYFDNRNTKQDSLRAISLGQQAVELDPHFVLGLASLAYSYLSYYRNYDRSTKWLDLAERAIEKAIALKPDSAHNQSVLGIYYIHRKDPVRAIAASQKGVDLDPTNWLRWFHLGFTFMDLGKPKEAAAAFEEAVARNPETLAGHFNLAIMYDAIDDRANAMRTAERALPHIKKYVTRHPDDQTQRLSYVTLLYFSGNSDEALREAEHILLAPGLDGNTFYNLACLYMGLHQMEKSLLLFEKSIDAGFRHIEIFKRMLGNDIMQNDPDSLAKYATLIERLEQTISRESPNSANA